MNRTLSAVAFAFLLASPVLAQTAAPAPAMSTMALSEQDREFMVKDAQGGAYEIALAALAQQRSSRDDVKAYATRLIQDHAVYNQALQELARAKGVTLPTAMTSEDQVRLNSINGQAGSTADASFIEEAIRINAEDKQAAAKEAASTSDPDVRAFLRKFEAVDAEHERMALALRR